MITHALALGEVLVANKCVRARTLALGEALIANKCVRVRVRVRVGVNARCGVVWRGEAWCGVAWCGLAWRAML